MDKKSRDLVMAKLYFKNKNYNLAEKSFNDYLATNPTDFNALKTLAQIYEQLRNYGEAFKTYEKCFMIEPDRTSVLLDICRILQRTDVNVSVDPIAHRRWLTLATKAFPSNPIVTDYKNYVSKLACADEDSQQSPQRVNTSSISFRQQPSDDTLTKILEKLTLMETKMANIERVNSILLDKINKPEVVRQPAPTSATVQQPKPSSITFQQATPTPVMFQQPTPTPVTFQQPTPTPLTVQQPPAPGLSLFTQTPSKPLFTNTNSGSIFGPLNTTPTANFFSDSLKKLEMPVVGSWTKISPGAGFSKSQPSENEENENENDDNDDDGPVENEELVIENTCDMKPIDYKTGEEDEDNLFEQRCKLFRFRDKEYKERGLGKIKVLKHKETGAGRLIMRREAIGLVCLNCWDCSKIERVRDTQVRWFALDASDGQAEPSVFLAKFKTPELTETFVNHMRDLFSDKGQTSLNNSQSNTVKPDQSKASGKDPVNPKSSPVSVQKSPALPLPDMLNQTLPNPTVQQPQAPGKSLFNFSPSKPLFTNTNSGSIFGSPFGSLNTSSTTNFFSDSLKKLDMPVEGSWTKISPGAGFSNSQPSESKENENDDNDDDGPVENEELVIENTCDMKPIDYKTGEEDEDNLFEQRCKLFRFRDKEYKERGLGKIKVLKHKETGAGRLIMRREAIGLVCLNCWDCSKIERVRDTQVRWSAIDASDGKAEPTIFLAKFKTPELTETFVNHMRDLFSDKGQTSLINSQSNGVRPAPSDASEVEVVNPIMDPVLVQKALALQLPEVFYHTLPNQKPCSGCAGCNDDDD